MLSFPGRVTVLAFVLASLGLAAAPLAQSRNLTPEAEWGLERFGVDPSGRWTVYVLDGRVHSQRLDRLSGPILLSGSSLGTPFFPASFAISPAGRQVVVQEGGTTEAEIYGVPIDGSLPPVRLNGPIAPGGYVFTFRIGPDGARVVYLADEDGDSLQELRSVPIDAAAPSVELEGSVNPAPSYEISPDAEQVVFEGSFPGTLASQTHVFSVPVDGTGTVVHLNAAIPNTRVLDFRIAPAGERVVFWAERTQFTRTTARLYSVRTDGVGGAVQISAPGGNVWLFDGNTLRVPFAFTPDGTRVVYVADHDTANQLELWSVPIDASAPAAKLNAPLVQAGDVTTADPTAPSFAFAPDGATVVYSADQELDGRVELYRVPLGGGGPALKLNGPIIALGGVQSFRLDPMGARVAYLADQDTDDVFELHSARLDGASGSVKLGGTADWYAFGPDGAVVAYVADEDLDGSDEIYRVPSDGSSLPRRLSPTPALVGGFFPVPPLPPLVFGGVGGPRVLFAGVDGLVEELHLGYLAKPLLQVPPFGE